MAGSCVELNAPLRARTSSAAFLQIRPRSPSAAGSSRRSSIDLRYAPSASSPWIAASWSSPTASRATAWSAGVDASATACSWSSTARSTAYRLRAIDPANSSASNAARSTVRRSVGCSYQARSASPVTART